MTTLLVKDLSMTKQVERAQMAAVRGGRIKEDRVHLLRSIKAGRRERTSRRSGTVVSTGRSSSGTAANAGRSARSNDTRHASANRKRLPPRQRHAVEHNRVAVWGVGPLLGRPTRRLGSALEARPIGAAQGDRRGPQAPAISLQARRTARTVDRRARVRGVCDTAAAGFTLSGCGTSCRRSGVVGSSCPPQESDCRQPEAMNTRDLARTSMIAKEGRPALITSRATR